MPATFLPVVARAALRGGVPRFLLADVRRRADGGRTRRRAAPRARVQPDAARG
jgi:hypothetical protein